MITKDYYKRYIWVEDNNGSGTYELVEEEIYTPQPEPQPIVPFTPVTAEIPDAAPPLAGLMEVTLPEEEEFVIMDGDIPLGNLPQTGSTANAAMGAAGLMAALFSLAGAGATLAKKEED